MKNTNTAINSFKISPHLYEFAKKIGCEPQEGERVYQNIEITGWWLTTNKDKSLFCLDETSREKLTTNAKYLHKAGGNAFPILFLSEEGVTNKISEQIRTRLIEEGCTITEGWKGGLALCYANINSFVIHGCQGGESLYKYLIENDISPDIINAIFADTDTLWNPIQQFL